ncbi:MAG: WG repeat-containing protein [Bacteroidota bacterium]
MFFFVYCRYLKYVYEEKTFFTAFLLGYGFVLLAQTLTIFSTGKSNSGTLYGLKNKQGEVVVPATYSELTWRSGLYQGRLNYRFVLLVSDGNLLTKEGYGYMQFPVNDDKMGVLIMVQNGDRYGYLTRKGEVAVPLDLEDATAFSWGFAVVKRNGLYGMINNTGKAIISYMYEKIKEVDKKHFLGTKDGKSHLLTSSGETLIITTLYDFIFPPYRNCLMVVKNNKYGIIDMSGKEILPVTFNKAYVLSRSFLFAHSDGFQYGYTATGTLLFKRKHERSEFISFQHPIAFTEAGLWGFYDTLGNVAIRPQFNDFDILNRQFLKVQ